MKLLAWPTLLALTPLALYGCAVENKLEPVVEPIFGHGDHDEIMDAEALAEAPLAELASLHGIGDVSDFVVNRAWVDDLGMAHVHAQQTVEGVPVFGSEAIVHLDEYGAVTSLTDTLLTNVQVDPIPDLSADEAIEEAVYAAGGWESQTDDARVELVVLRHEGKDWLVWDVRLDQLGSDAHGMPRVFVDAHTGAPVWSYDNLKHVAGSGTSGFYGSVSFQTTSSGGTYYLEDTTRDIGTYTYNNTSSSLYYLTDTDNAWTAASQKEGVDGHHSATKAYDYYNTQFGRAGVNGANGPGYVSSITGSGTVLSVFVQYSRNYVNASWNGSYIEIGSGDGVNSGPLTTLDIVGHELTHGVTENEANLTYANESGAIDESLADVFGAMIERYTLGDSADVWLMGEDTWTPSVSGDALRYMGSPTSDGESRDHYSSRYTGTADGGGVHLNSGIGNLAFYLLVNGGSHPRLGGTAMTGIGADAAAAIWYRALTTYLTSSATYATFRTATLSAASDLYGATSTQYTAVGNAWALVGVGSSSSGGGGSTTTCPTGYTTYTGSLSGTGTSAYVPDSAGYATTRSGTHRATLSGPSSADFDLYLYKVSGRRWNNVASSTADSSTESISYSGSSGTYRAMVYSYSGSGSYTVCLSRP